MPRPARAASGFGAAAGSARTSARAGSGAARHRRIDRHDIGILRRRHIGQRAQRQAVADRANRRAPGTACRAASSISRSASAGRRRRRSSAAPAAHSRSAWSGRARTPAPCGRALPGPPASELDGSTLSGSLPSLQQPLGRVLIGLGDHLGADAELVGDRRRAALRASSASDLAALLSPAISAGSLQTGSPSRAPVEREGPARQRFRPDTTCPGRSAGSRPARSARAAGGSARRPCSRLVGPTAAVFHSSASKSSIDTKVGSPPMVRRTSLSLSTWSTSLPSASSASQASSENGLVMRGCSATRSTRMSKSNSTLAKLATPVIGAALRIVRRGGERHMAFAGQQAGGRVEPDPAGARQVDLAPGVQVGEVASVPGGPSSATRSGFSWIR